MIKYSSLTRLQNISVYTEDEFYDTNIVYNEGNILFFQELLVNFMISENQNRHTSFFIKGYKIDISSYNIGDSIEVNLIEEGSERRYSPIRVHIDSFMCIKTDMNTLIKIRCFKKRASSDSLTITICIYKLPNENIITEILEPETNNKEIAVSISNVIPEIYDNEEVYEEEETNSVDLVNEVFSRFLSIMKGAN